MRISETQLRKLIRESLSSSQDSGEQPYRASTEVTSPDGTKYRVSTVLRGSSAMASYGSEYYETLVFDHTNLKSHTSYVDPNKTESYPSVVHQDSDHSAKSAERTHRTIVSILEKHGIQYWEEKYDDDDY
jgi:2,3-bisphosphoglycerate-independent phosphoglycerate mutase